MTNKKRFYISYVNNIMQMNIGKIILYRYYYALSSIQLILQSTYTLMKQFTLGWCKHILM